MSDEKDRASCDPLDCEDILNDLQAHMTPGATPPLESSPKLITNEDRGLSNADRWEKADVLPEDMQPENAEPLPASKNKASLENLFRDIGEVYEAPPAPNTKIDDLKKKNNKAGAEELHWAVLMTSLHIDETNLPNGHPSFGKKHLKEMTKQLLLDTSDIEKSNRWLGWMQACIVMGGGATLEDMKAINKEANI